MRNFYVAATIFLLAVHFESFSQCDSSFFRYAATRINDISVLSTDTIVALGEYKNIIKSTDGGYNWRVVPIDLYPSSSLNALQFPSQNIGYAAGVTGTGGAILKTEDQGNNWFTLYTGYQQFSDIFFFDDNKGFALDINGHLFATTDGGVNWKDTIISYFGYLNSIYFFDDSLGFITGRYNTLFRTSNGGKSWDLINIDNIGFNQNVLNLEMATSKIGYAVGYDLITKTTDGGLTWSRLNVGTQDIFSDLFVYDAKKVVVVGGDFHANILRTTDGGTTWKLNYDINATPALTVITSDRSRKKLVAAGGRLDYHGRSILFSLDSGLTWSTTCVTPATGLADLQFFNDSTGLIGAGNFLYKTYDYGETWKRSASIFATTGIQLISFMDTLYGYAAGYSYDSSALHQTVNGGKTWIRRSVPGLLGGLYDRLKFINASTGFLSSYGVVYRTTDSAKSWSPVIQPNFNISDFTFTRSQRAFAVGYGGEMYTSSDTGKTWHPYDLKTSEWLTAVYFYDDSLGFIGTADSVLFRTTDGGNTWKKISSTLRYSQTHTLLFTDKQNGYLLAAEFSGTSNILQTKDGGLTWSLVWSELASFRNMSGFKRVYLAGSNAVMLKTDSNGPPSMPGYIIGPDKSCVGEVNIYSTTNKPDVSFVWGLSEGGMYGYNKTSDTVKWVQEGTHQVLVAAQNACGVSKYQQKVVDVILFKPEITQSDSTLTATQGLGYQWYLNDVEISPAQGGTKQTFVAHTVGYYRVEVVSPYGCMRSSEAYYYSGALAVQILSFTGILVNATDARLQWTVAGENGVDHYDLQRSIDGIHYITIAKINVSYNQQLHSQYQYTDKNIVSLKTSPVFYRLEEVDKDGHTYLSKTVLVNIVHRLTVTVQPNPVSSFVQVQINNEFNFQYVQIQAFSSAGNIMLNEMKSISTGTTTVAYNIEAWPFGVYLLRIFFADGTLKEIKIVKS